MNSVEIKRKLVELCINIFGVISIDTHSIEYLDFVDDLGMDSIMFITLIVEIENYFEIIIPDELLLIDNFKKVGNVVKIITDQLEIHVNNTGDYEKQNS